MTPDDLDLIDRVTLVIQILIESTNPASRAWAEAELEKLKVARQPEAVSDE